MSTDRSTSVLALIVFDQAIEGGGVRAVLMAMQGGGAGVEFAAAASRRLASRAYAFHVAQERAEAVPYLLRVQAAGAHHAFHQDGVVVAAGGDCQQIRLDE